MSRGYPDLDVTRAVTLERIRVAHRTRGLTAPELATKVRVSERTVRRLLNGYTCGEGTLWRTAAALGVPRPGSQDWLQRFVDAGRQLVIEADEVDSLAAALGVEIEANVGVLGTWLGVEVIAR